MLKLNVAGLIAIAIVSGFSPARTGGQDLPRITEFIVQGNKETSREAIIRASRLKLGDEVSPTEVMEAKDWILATGNFGSSLSIPREGVEVSSENHDGKAVITIKVVENPIVTEIKVRGNGPIAVSSILAAMQTKRQSILNLPHLQWDVEAIQKLYDERGYQAFVERDIGLKDGTLNIPIRIGQIRSITLKGLSRVKEQDVRKRLKLKNGDYYNVNELKRQLTNLFNMNKFEQVEPAFSFPAPGEMDLVLNFTEKARK